MTQTKMYYIYSSTNNRTKRRYLNLKEVKNGTQFYQINEAYQMKRINNKWIKIKVKRENMGKYEKKSLQLLYLN